MYMTNAQLQNRVDELQEEISSILERLEGYSHVSEIEMKREDESCLLEFEEELWELEEEIKVRLADHLWLRDEGNE